MSAATDLGSHSWMNEGACLHEDPELFFPIGDGGVGAKQVRRAKSVCDECAVQAACLRFALANRVRDGIWGGHTEQERQGLIRKQQRRQTRGPLGPRRGGARV